MSTELNVCMVGSLPQPTGGLSTLCYYEALQLARLGVNLQFIDMYAVRSGAGQLEKDIPPGVHYHQRGNLIRQIRQAGLKHPLRLLSIARRLTRFRHSFKGFRELLYALGRASTVLLVAHRTGSQLIHSYHAIDRSLAAVLAAQALGLPVVVSVMSSEFTNPKLRAEKKEMTDYILKHADGAIAISRFTATVCEQHTGRQAMVIYPGVDTERYYPCTSAEKRQLAARYDLDERPILLFAGRLVPEKGCRTLLEAFVILQREYGLHDIQSVVVGPDWGEKDALLAYVLEQGITDSVSVLGEVPYSDLRCFYSLADIFVFPTMQAIEGFGLVAAEAMACGTPVVAANIAAIPEVVRDHLTGLLFEPGNAADLAAKLVMLLSNEPLKQAFVIRGRPSVEESFSWPAGAQQILQVYQHCLS
jgi:glycosyltransferase involved in cell wall biosynthesis